MAVQNNWVGLLRIKGIKKKNMKKELKTERTWPNFFSIGLQEQ